MKKQLKLVLLCIGLLILVNNAFALVDPTQPSSFIPATQDDPNAASGPLLTAIFIYKTYQMAIINGQPHKIGDRIGELTISSITENTVELAGSNNEKTVLSLGSDVKQKSVTIGR